ncbi:MAG: zinc-dependent metalloprotease family protein [Flavobacteriales bacterium]
MRSSKTGVLWGSMLFLLLFTLHAQGQAPSAAWWSDSNEREMISSGERRIVPVAYRTVRVNLAALNELLEGANRGAIPEMDIKADRSIALPMPDGTMARFRFMEASVMHPELQAQFPMIRTYAGQGIDDPGATVRFDLTPHGFHAMILSATHEAFFIDPYAFGNTTDLICYRKADFHKQLEDGFHFCSFDEVNDAEHIARRAREVVEALGAERAGDCQFRTYSLALACTGEYAAFQGGTVPLVAAAMVTTLNRVNQMFERDATLTLQLVANNNSLIYLNSSTDPYTNNNGSTMLGQNITTCNSVIGSTNYDIGHVFSTGGGGVAYLGSVCTSNKAGGVTGSGAPVGDPFDIDYVAHEMGHQFGGNHSQNNNCNRSSAAAVEVGSGITIMGYAGVCSPDVAAHSDAMYGGYSLVEIHTFITGAGHTCDAVTGLVNSSPTASAGVDRVIPRSTPFLLGGTGSDANSNDVLTYSWEQMDNAVATQPPVSTSTGGPCFRPFLPTTSNQRFFPNLNAIIANTTPTWEVLASVGRTYNFRLTVRDNAVGGGCNAQDNMVVTVNATAGPFLVTAPNTAVSWTGSSTQTVTWNVAGTTAAPVSCASVDILLSTNGGLTWATTLLSATPNDGSETITVPNTPTTTARIIVKASGNVFFDMSNTNFTITASAQAQANVKLWLDGPYDSGTGLMTDSLRDNNLIPLSEPYSAMGYANTAGGGGETTTAGVLATTGPNAVVDWVRIELRLANDPTSLVASRHALVQRDGDVVAANGAALLTFGLAPGNYYVVVRHRNHLGAMTLAAVNFTGPTPTVDFRSAATNTYGTNARKTIGSAMVLWAGNVLIDAPPPIQLKYVGGNNDRDPILAEIGGSVPTNTVTGYLVTDVNMDGIVKYIGASNDRDPILANIGGSVPTNTLQEQVP